MSTQEEIEVDLSAFPEGTVRKPTRKPPVGKLTSASRPEHLHGRVLKLAYQVAAWPEPAYKLCARAGFSQPYMSRWLNGNPIPINHLYSLCKVMNLNPFDLLGYIDLPDPDTNG